MSDYREVWTPASSSFEYPQEVLQVKEDMNNRGFEGVMFDLPVLDRAREFGIDHMVIGAEGSSTEQTAVLYLAYANKLTPHNQIKGDFIRRVLQEAGIADSEGKPLPVTVIASPSRGSTIKGLSDKNLERIEKGYFYSAVAPSIEIVRRRNFGKVGLIGHSQGGTFAVHGASLAGGSLDLAVVAPSDMPGTKEFVDTELAKVFGADSKYLEKEVIDAGLTPYTQALGYDKQISAIRRNLQNARFGLDVISHPILSHKIFSGLGRLTFLEALKEGLEAAPTTLFVVGYGTEDKIVAEADQVEGILEEARSSQDPYATNVNSVELNGSRHTWSDNVPLYATFVLHAYQKAEAA